MAKKQSIREMNKKREYNGDFSYLSSSCFYYRDPDYEEPENIHYGVNKNGIKSTNG